MERWLSRFDMWEIYPTLFYSKNRHSFQTVLNGITITLFLIIMTVYVSIQIDDYINHLDSVASSRIIESQSESYNITNKELYLGAGLLYKDSNGNYVPLPIEQFNQYFTMNFILHFNNNSQIYLNTTSCKAERFYFDYEWKLLSKENALNLSNYLKSYSCVDDNATIYMENNDLINQESYLQVMIDFKKINFREAVNFLNKNVIKMQLVYSSYMINVLDKLEPLKSFIDFLNVYLDFEFKKKFTMQIIPFQIYDDNSRFSLSNYQLYNNPNIINEIVNNFFDVEQKFMKFQHYLNRTEKDLNLNNFEFVINNNIRKIYRDYNKITSSISNTQSIIFMVYTFISLISRFLNKKCMELHLASKVSYSRELNHLYNIINDPLTKRSKKKEQKDIEISNTHLKSFHSKKETEKKSYIERSKSIKKVKFFKNLKRFNTLELENENSFLRNLMVFFENKVLYKGFLDRLGFCKKHEIMIPNFNSCMNRVSDVLSLDKYIKLQDEFSLIKKIIFNKRQQITFEFISKLNNSDCTSFDEFHNDIEILETFKKTYYSSDEKDLKIMTLLKKKT